MGEERKTGILTFHASHNCGSMMQAYALQKFLDKNKINNEIIDFSNVGQRDMYAVVHKKKNIKNLIKNILLFPYRGKIQKQWEDYEEFKRKNLRLSKENYQDIKQLESTNQQYDTFISGADQIWNVTIKDADDAYFLNFVEKGKKKIAYAPSFGAKDIQKYAETPLKYADYLKEYDFLSIREENGQKWIKELIGKDVPIVLDPTLLLTQEDYQDLEIEVEEKGKYIFYYAPQYNTTVDQFVKKIAKKYKLKVIVWNVREYYLKSEWTNGFQLPHKINPSMYLKLIKNAELVITTSFHGVIFSTIYKKRFWVIKNKGMYEDDDRVKTLIKQLGIENRLIEVTTDVEKDYLQEVEYKIYEERLAELQEKSIEYLIGSINNEK